MTDHYGEVRVRRRPLGPFGMDDHDEMTGCGDWPPPRRPLIVNITGQLDPVAGFLGGGPGGPPGIAPAALTAYRPHFDRVMRI